MLPALTPGETVWLTATNRRATVLFQHGDLVRVQVVTRHLTVRRTALATNAEHVERGQALRQHRRRNRRG